MFLLFSFLIVSFVFFNYNLVIKISERVPGVNNDYETLQK